MKRRKRLLALLAGSLALLLVVGLDPGPDPPTDGKRTPTRGTSRPGPPASPRAARMTPTTATLDSSAGSLPGPAAARLLTAPRFALRTDEKPDDRTFSGIVRNRITSEPIGGAELSIQPVAAGQQLRRAATDKEGRFKTHVPSAGRYEIRIAAPGFASQKKDRVHLQKSSFLIFELTPLARLEGRVVDSAGRGVSGAHLSTSRVAGDRYVRRTGYRTDSDAKGFFSFEKLPGSGEYELKALHSRHGSVSRTVSLPADESITVRMGSPEPETALAVVRGRVRQPGGEPVAKASITLFDPDSSGLTLTQTFTDSDGRFRSPPVRPGKIGVSARAEGFVTAAQNSLNLEAEEGETVDVELVLTRAIPFVGTVTDRTGQPVVRAKVVVSAPGGGAYGAISDENGFFSFAGATPGVNDLMVRHLEYLTHRGQVTLPHEGTYPVILEEGLVFAGVAKRRDGAALEEFRLELLEPGTGRLKHRAPVKAQSGNFEIRGLRPDSYVVRLTSRDSHSAQAELTLDRSRTVVLLFEDSPGRLTILDFR